MFVCKIKSDTEFDGYAGKKELTSSKIMTDVFKKGDRYFNSGDLLTVDKDYFVYFSDRIGDTFRCVFSPRLVSFDQYNQTIISMHVMLCF